MWTVVSICYRARKGESRLSQLSCEFCVAYSCKSDQCCAVFLSSDISLFYVAATTEIYLHGEP